MSLLLLNNRIRSSGPSASPDGRITNIVWGEAEPGGHAEPKLLPAPEIKIVEPDETHAPVASKTSRLAAAVAIVLAIVGAAGATSAAAEPARTDRAVAAWLEAHGLTTSSQRVLVQTRGGWAP